MLIEFTVKNFRSFKDETKLSMVATADKEKLDTNCFKADGFSMPLLNSAVIYGANASGKSNLVKAFGAMLEIVKSPAQQRGDEVGSIDHFEFSEDSKKEPTMFEAVFLTESIRFQYGFSATQEKIYEEWLFAYPTTRAQTWFARKWNGEENDYVWNLQNGKYLDAKGELLETYIKTTRENELFLSKTIQNNNKKLIPVFDWFIETLHISGVDGWKDGEELTFELLNNGHSKQQILSILKDVDIGLDDVKVKTEDFNPNMLDEMEEEIPKKFKDEIINKLSGKQMVIEEKTVRNLKNGRVCYLDFEEESDGTKKLFSLLGPFLHALENGYVVIFDELHNSLHPLLLEYLIALFHNKEINTKNAQLIFTTHETEVLKQEIFRRDQVWFCNKNSDHESYIEPLSDYKARKGENLSKGYLMGRYGGIPYIENIRQNMGVESGN